MLRVVAWLVVVAFAAGPGEAAMDVLVAGNNRFALDLHGKLRERPGNFVFSPYSISTALAMARTGAVGPTAAEMVATLHLPTEGKALDEGFAALRRQIEGQAAGRTDQVEVANALWGQQGLAYRPEFLRRAEAGFGAGLRQVDFLGDPQGSRKAINAWVERQTRDKIKDLLAPSDVGTSTDLILTNAIYFKGAWATPFPKALTVDAAFGDGQTSKPVPTMHLGGSFGYFEDDDLQSLELPYVGGDLATVVFLPRKLDGLAALEKSLTAGSIASWLGKATRRSVEVALPRFGLRSSVDLVRTLASMGMPTAFGPEADFSGIAADRRLRLSAAIHKASVDLNEEGTEAAAATGLGMRRTLAVRPRQGPVVFRADHPFLFLIQDARSGSILFLGRVVDPPG